MISISMVLWWSGGVILAAIAVVVFVLYFRGTFRDRIEYKLINVPSPDEARFGLALATLSNFVMTPGRRSLQMLCAIAPLRELKC